MASRGSPVGQRPAAGGKRAPRAARGITLRIGWAGASALVLEVSAGVRQMTSEAQQIKHASWRTGIECARDGVSKRGGEECQ
eukprot:5593159-Pleurochrysis_carterae.AAC.1